MCKRLLEQKQKLICINDSFKDEDLQSIKDQMNDSLKTIFPDKSSFEL
ncbi:MAG: hypothetical protein GX777_05750 [Fastidiosipila sp.]|nr:hypothetical protein [Fastidiosipila sp.]